MSELATQPVPDIHVNDSPVGQPATEGQVAPRGELVVHHLNNSRSQRILWLLVSALSLSTSASRLALIISFEQEELEVPYTIKKYQRTPERVAPKELKDVHPLGKSPVITDGDLVVAESGAIVGEPFLICSVIRTVC